MTNSQLTAAEVVAALLIEEIGKSSNVMQGKMGKANHKQSKKQEPLESACTRAALRLMQTAIELVDYNSNIAIDKTQMDAMLGINPLTALGNAVVIEKLVEKTQVWIM